MSKRVRVHKWPHDNIFEIKLRRHPDYRIFVIIYYAPQHLAAVFIQHHSLADELTLQRQTLATGQCQLSELMYSRPRYHGYSPREMNKQLNFRVMMLARNQDKAVAMLKRRRAVLGYCG